MFLALPVYLPRSLHVDGDDLEAVAAELTGPAAALADPLQQTLLMGVADRAVTAARVQQVALRPDTHTHTHRLVNREAKSILRCVYYHTQKHRNMAASSRSYCQLDEIMNKFKYQTALVQNIQVFSRNMKKKWSFFFYHHGESEHRPTK